MALLYFANHDEYPRAFRWIEAKLLDELARLTGEEALTLLRYVDDVQQGDSHEDEKERWRSDPHAEKVWPELEAVIQSYAERLEQDRERLRDAERSQ